MDSLPAALLGLAVAWAVAGVSTWRSGSARPAAWCATTAGAHAVAAGWLPATPLAIAAWLACGLAFPTGRLGTSWRRALSWVGLAAAAGCTLAIADAGAFADAGGAGPFAAAALAVALIAGGGTAIRWRAVARADRWLLQWLLATVVLAAAFGAVLIALHYLVDAPRAAGPWLVGTLAIVPLGQALAAWPRAKQAADLVLVESVVIAGLAAFVVFVYLVVVIGLGEVPVGRERDVLVSSLFAAVVIAVLALPVRQRFLGIGAMFLSGHAAAAEQSLANVGSRMTRAIPMDELLLQIAESLHATVATAGAELWVGQDGVLTRAVSVPRRPPGRIEFGGQERVVVARARIGGPRWSSVWLPALMSEANAETGPVAANGARPDLRVAPISHLGELLGLVVARRHADAAAFSEEDERLLVELARQLGLALHNVRLDSALQASLEELQRRNTELQASRLRIVTAADESRRAIERNLHDGAQQYLVALAVKLNVAGQVATEEPAMLPEMLEELRGDVQATIRELRELAHGIYPPLLRDRGLGEALRTAANRSPLPCTLEVDLAGRYPQDVETAVYFCCLEALQNAGKHAGDAARVTVRVGGDNDEIWFAVEDDGAGFHPSGQEGSGFLNMRDRLGAVGGCFDVTSGLGEGTSVRGSIPTPAAASTPAAEAPASV